MYNNKSAILVIFLSFAFCCLYGQKIDLTGKWQITLDSTSIGESKGWHNTSFTQNTTLPGSTDDAKMGVANTLEPALQKPQLLHLTRSNRYVGQAWYTKEITIPKKWNGKQILFNMERVLWRSDVWIDGKKVEKSCNSLTTPHLYDLTNYLSAGRHRITVRIDNRKQYADISVNDMCHAYTDHTQIMWNGILGDVSLTAQDAVNISYVEITPDIKTKSITVKSHLNNTTSQAVKTRIEYESIHTNNKDRLDSYHKDITIPVGTSVVEHQYQLGDKAELWDEFNPAVYSLTVKINNGVISDEYKSDFGLRDFSRNGNTITNNGVPVFLRGTLECCIFPLTGYPPTTEEGWHKVFATAKEWGLNHLRFHSWCPPKAAFEMADKMGFYLQVELPVWSLDIGKDKNMTYFLHDEAERIIREYGNHPSFCMFSLGNELQGDMSVLSSLVTKLKERDSRRLYTNTSFTFEKGHGDWPENNDDYFITQWTKKGWVRGQGVFNSEIPSFDKDYSNSVEGMSVPLITHEIGQYALYPDIKEIEKYKGVLEPINFISVKKDLEKKGLIDKAEDYLLASGKLAAILYKEEIERALKTAGISGFQLLDLRDFPGQGSALVGLLNAFWDSKGVIDAEHFRAFCAPVVPLLRFEQATYKNNEIFYAEIEISNYSKSTLDNKDIKWTIASQDGKVIKTDNIKSSTIRVGHNAELGEIKFPMNNIDTPSKLTVSVEIEGTEYKNSWNIWVYPSSEKLEYGNVITTRDFTEAQQLLDEGKTVLYNPDWRFLNGIEGKFVPVFWSPVHFPNQAGSMGVLCDRGHPAFKEFPTDNHTDWQWWDLNIHSTTMVTDSLDGGTSIVSMVDNFTNNRRLSSVYEGKVGNGKLIISSIDLCTKIDERPVARQLLHSLLNYMNSESFDPKPLNNFHIFDRFLLKEQRKINDSAKSIY